MSMFPALGASLAIATSFVLVLQGCQCFQDPSKQCPDGSTVWREPPACQFPACPTSTSTNDTSTSFAVKMEIIDLDTLKQDDLMEKLEQSFATVMKVDAKAIEVSLLFETKIGYKLASD